MGSCWYGVLYCEEGRMKSRQKGYYAVIQFCPDHSRLETVNVGVLVFCSQRRSEGRLWWAMSEENDRARRFFPGLGCYSLNGAKGAISARLAEIWLLRDLQKFIKSRANEIVISNLRPVMFDANEKLAKVILRLYDELVAEPSYEELDEAMIHRCRG